MPVPHHLVDDHLRVALEALVDAGRASRVEPWRLRDDTVIGMRVHPVDGVTPLSIDTRPPRNGAACHPGACAAEDSGLYRLHARLYGEGCTHACLASHPSVAHFAAIRLGAALASTLSCDTEDVVRIMHVAARPLPGAAPAADPARPLADVLFA